MSSSRERRTLRKEGKSKAEIAVGFSARFEKSAARKGGDQKVRSWHPATSQDRKLSSALGGRALMQWTTPHDRVWHFGDIARSQSAFGARAVIRRASRQ